MRSTHAGILSLIVVTVVGPWSGPAHAETIRVPADYETIQEAIDAARHRDIVLVSPGVYVETIDLLGKGITLESTNGPYETIIDGNKEGSVIRCTSREGPDTVIRGFGVTNGSGRFGLGMVIRDFSGPVVEDCWFFENQSVRSVTKGGAIFVRKSNPIIRQCRFENNQAFEGGAIHCTESRAVIEDCQFVRNRAGSAGAISNKKNAPTLIQRCLFVQNAETRHGTGGIRNSESSHAVIRRCVFVDNFGEDIMNYLNVEATIEDCLFQKRVTNNGSYIINEYTSTPSITRCTFDHNNGLRGHAIDSLHNSRAAIQDCDFYVEDEYWAIRGLYHDLGGNRYAPIDETLRCLEMTIDPLVIEETAEFVVTGGHDGARVAILASPFRGVQFLDGWQGYCSNLGIRGVSRETAVGQGIIQNGMLVIRRLIAPNLRGKTLHFQAVEQGNCGDVRDCDSAVTTRVVQE